MTASNASNVTTNAVGQEIVITRLFEAPRELVFKAWTEARP